MNKLRNICLIVLILSILVVSVSAKELNADEISDKINEKISERIGDLKDKLNEDISPLQDSSVLVTEDYKKNFGKIVFTHFKSNSKLSDKLLKRSYFNYNKQCSIKLGAKWFSSSLPVTFYINPTNSQGLSQDFLTSTMTSSLKTWDDKTSKKLVSKSIIIDPTATYGYDYKNSIMFTDISDAGIIAQTTVWYYPSNGQIVETDVQFNTKFTWGNAKLDSTIMDVQDIATHELGHSFGAGDVYDNRCSEVTMYGYGSYGETFKRTLESPDMYILRQLYGY